MSLYLIEDAVCQFVKQSDCENVKIFTKMCLYVPQRQYFLVINLLTSDYFTFY